MSKNKDKVFINTQIREDGKKVNIFDKVNRIRSDLKSLLPEIEDDKIIHMFSHARNFFYGKLHYGRRNVPENRLRKRELTPAETILLDYMMKNKLNPSTTYRWMIACRVPADIKEKLAKGQVSIMKAMQISANRKRVRESNTGLMMIEEINNIVRSL
ncbi:hypothetical protein HYV89_04035 [Candidatus Woesearchaeota archaeon]|nr:hypothetical protein [Candidatus Woesearchaeota archaeon]